MTELEHEPNQARDAEVSLLGAAMSGYPEMDDLLEMVEPADFYHPFHGQVWDAIARVHRAGNAPEPVSVRLALNEAQIKHDPIRLFDFTQLVPLIGQAPYYAQQVATSAGLRAIQEAGIKVQQLGKPGGELDERREQARQIIDDATQGRVTSKARSLADVLPGVLDVAQNGTANVLGTGYPDLDRLIGGLAPGRLVVFGARPGIGKSLMGTNLALHFAAHHHHAALIASLEMPEDEVGQRLLAAFAGVNLSGLQDGSTDERSWDLIARKHAELESLPITIDDAPIQTTVSIRKRARDIQRQRDDLALIVVDYLQLVKPASARSNRVEELGEISRGLKLLARETGACVVAMAQLNREGTKHSDGKPRMTDLRESGSIEADADQVILMHQPDDDVPELEVIVDKNRHGPKGVCSLKVRGHYARLDSVHWTPTGAIA